MKISLTILFAMTLLLNGCQPQPSTESNVGDLLKGINRPARPIPAADAAFLKACARGEIDKIKVYLAKGGSLNVTKDGYTGLHFAARSGKAYAVRVLIKAGSDINARTEQSGAQPLHLAAISGNVKTVMILVEAGADPHAKAYISTPLEFAEMKLHSVKYDKRSAIVIQQHEAVVQYLKSLP